MKRTRRDAGTSNPDLPAVASRGEATRAVILQAARERFAREGYERATIRAIAADSACDPALVMRYFGDKHNLFATAAEFDLALPMLTSLPRRRLGVLLVEHFVARWERDDVLLALLRAACSQPAAVERMRAVFAAQLVPSVAALHDERASLVQLRCALIASQMLGFAFCRYVLELPPLAAPSGHDRLVRVLGATIQDYLTCALE